MTITGLGIETFNCLKRVCGIERIPNESSRSDPTQREVQNTGVKKIVKSLHKVYQQEDESSGS